MSYKLKIKHFSWGDLQQYARQKKNRTYILKPDTGCQGKGIWITKTPKEIKATENLICQTYISRVSYFTLDNRQSRNNIILFS